MKFSSIFVTVFFLFLSGVSIAQNSITLPPQTNTFTGNTRGYWFIAPSDFTITSVRVPTDASTDPQSIVVMKLASIPVNFPGSTTAYTTEALFQNIPGALPISVNIPVTAGEIIGVLGSRGSNSTNSYGQPNPVNSTILGQSILLNRLVMQSDLEVSWPFAVSSDPANNNIGRVEINVNEPSAPIPTMSQWGLLVFGLLIINFGVFFVQQKEVV